MSGAVLLGPGEGEAVADQPDRSVHVKADLDEIALSEFRYGPGRHGPDRHIHREHSDGFYVLEGELTIELADQTVQAGPGTLAIAPPGVVHTFRNDSGADARFLNIHAPSMGFPAYMRGDKPDFDQLDPPADGGRPFADAILRRPGEGESIETDHLAVTVVTVAPGFQGEVPHRDDSTVNCFFVLDGVLTGSHALVPPGAAHTFSNPSDQQVRMLNVTAID